MNQLYLRCENYFNKKELYSNLNSIGFIASGFLLLILYLIQLQFEAKLDFLFELQKNSIYKQVTGFLLLLYVLNQFRLAKLRNSRELHFYHFSLHKIQGVFAPLALFFHSMELGYAYQVLLSGLFLANCAIGLLSPQQLKLRNIMYLYCWLILHVGVAVMVLGLVFYHLFITYWYS